MRLPRILILLTLCGGFFSGACTTAQRQEAIDYIEKKIEERVKEGVEVAKEYVDKKVAEREQMLLAKIDADLLKVADVNPETGEKVPLTWRNFDEDGNGVLSATEIAKVSAYEAAQVAKKVATGEMSTEDAKKYGTGAATTLGLLGLIALYRRSRGGPVPTPPPAPLPTTTPGGPAP